MCVCAAETYIPEVTIVRPGETVTVYCVFNNRMANASTAEWILNQQNQVHSSKYQAVNQWVSITPYNKHIQWGSCQQLYQCGFFLFAKQVSKVTLQASENRMLDVLQCRKWADPYSLIYIEGKCESPNKTFHPQTEESSSLCPFSCCLGQRQEGACDQTTLLCTKIAPAQLVSGGLCFVLFWFFLVTFIVSFLPPVCFRSIHQHHV